MIIETGGEIKGIARMVRKSNDHGSFDMNTVEKILINQYQAIDISDSSEHFNIVVNSNIMYRVHCKNPKAIVDSMIRDSQINKIIQ
jgi:hypothetical protein